jgi:ketose-bisphosphate aldolase
MPLIAMNHLLRHALENTYAVGYFESWNLESLLAVVDAAEKTKSPVIIGFNGTFLGHDERHSAENIYHYGRLCQSIAEQATVPVALILNEADQVSILIQALQAGFNAIMYVNEKNTFEETIEITKYLVKTAHYCGAYVEGEVGELPTADIATHTLSAGALTDPERAAFFVEQTGVDGLAVSVGNVHLLEGRKAKLDFDLIKTLREKIPVPLVLHGATGIADEELQEAITLGMCKINVGTVFKRIYLNAIKTYLCEHKVDAMNPHDVVGKGGHLDLLSNAREMIAAEVIRLIRLFGSENRAYSW